MNTGLKNTTASKSNTDNPRLEPQQISPAPFIIALLLLILVLIWVFRPKTTSSVTATAQATAALETLKVTVNGTDRTSEVAVASNRSLAQQKPRDIRRSQVDHLATKRGQTYLVMADGSELKVTAGVKATLNPDLTFRMDYHGPK